MAIFMKFGDKVKGDIDTPQYKTWIMVESFQFGSGRGIGSATASGGNRQGSHASVSEVTISKHLDPSSLPLWRDSLDGKLATTVDFSFTRADQDNSEYLHVTLWDTGVSGWSMSSGGDRPSESVSLNFAKIELKDITQGVDGAAASNTSVTYDLTKQTAG
jgi:type VI secretion system secreted protein Hcp